MTMLMIIPIKKVEDGKDTTRHQVRTTALEVIPIRTKITMVVQIDVNGVVTKVINRQVVRTRVRMIVRQDRMIPLTTMMVRQEAKKGNCLLKVILNKDERFCTARVFTFLILYEF